MKQELLEMICCPRCRGDLTPTAFTTAPYGGVKDGVLLCRACRLRYPVLNGIPVLLLFRTQFHEEFERRFRERLRECSAYSSPNEKPEEGEKSVQETFTEEWDPIATSDDDLTFTYTLEDLVKLNRDVWLKWLWRRKPRIASTLVVGCGGGREATAVAGLLPDSQIVGVDINLAVLRSGPRLLIAPRMHVVVASLFHLPFRKGMFDLVYSQGVIHHNLSTRAAFSAIARHVRPGGFLFVWVYGLDDHLIRKGAIGVVTRLNYLLEWALRPVVSRSPRWCREAFFRVLGVVLHPFVLSRARHRDAWHLKNTIHGLRDWLSPRYAHTHSYNEVVEWYEREGFAVIDVQSPAAYWDLVGRRLWGVGLTGEAGAAQPAASLGEQGAHPRPMVPE